MENENKEGDREYKIELEKYKNHLKERLDNNQNWFFASMSAVSIFWIGGIGQVLSTKNNMYGFWFIIILSFVISIISILFNLFLDMIWTDKKIENIGTGENTIELDIYQWYIRNILIYIGFIGQLLAILFSLIFLYMTTLPIEKEEYGFGWSTHHEPRHIQNISNPWDGWIHPKWIWKGESEPQK